MCRLCRLCSCFDAEIFQHSSFGKVVSLRRRQGAKEAVSFNYLFVERAVVKVIDKIQTSFMYSNQTSFMYSWRQVQCVVKLSSAGLVSVVCGVGGVVIVKVSTTQLQLRPQLRPATAPWLVLPEGGRWGRGRGG